MQIVVNYFVIEHPFTPTPPKKTKKKKEKKPYSQNCDEEKPENIL